MTSEPPPFQEAARCDVCNCSFNTFKRRHHCRCCGRTLCSEHSSQQMALPQFGIYSSVRVCADCYNDTSRSGNYVTGPNASLDGAISSVADTVSKLDIGEKDQTSELPVDLGTTSNIECKCGMPLCICQAPTPPPKVTTPIERKTTPSASSQMNPKPKRAGTSRNKTSDTNSKLGSTSNAGQATDNSQNNTGMDYEVNGEGAREAIKNSDTSAIRKLLSQGVDANYRDKQGFSLLHLAALFNQTEIAFILIDNGARLDSKNAQGETPLDCAPTTLQFKIREKLRETEQQ
uniref:FYVE-type domain-containing protein n=1 Tax=Kalanchoe fedtschenkoi TaxID=63787 RepID=A0A7N0T0S5_KALFE